MDFNEVMQHDNIDFSGTESSYFLLGLLSAFDNRFQAVADKLIGEISWKQFFTIICINLCKEPPTLKELAEIMGSSHQNTKQILIKLEQKGFVEITSDVLDKRKQRISLTNQCLAFCAANDDKSMRAVDVMFGDIPEEQLRTTIQTIMQMEHNLKKLNDICS
ncbi:MAG: MarR family transcriptional regulator [Lachnospiraceae bacterium]|nr:MarR family transcriptional regulator [Lachnospiraceae bacterium]